MASRGLLCAVTVRELVNSSALRFCRFERIFSVFVGSLPGAHKGIKSGVGEACIGLPTQSIPGVDGVAGMDGWPNPKVGVRNASVLMGTGLRKIEGAKFPPNAVDIEKLVGFVVGAAFDGCGSWVVAVELGVPGSDVVVGLFVPERLVAVGLGVPAREAAAGLAVPARAAAVAAASNGLVLNSASVGLRACSNCCCCCNSSSS